MNVGIGKASAQASGIMSFTRRLIAVLVLIAIAPSSLLAGMPLKYCQAAGHQAIELVFGNAHGGEHGSHHVSREYSHSVDDCGKAIAAIREADCRDAALVDLAPPPFSASFGTPTPSILPAETAYPPSLAIEPRLFSRIACASPRPDPRLTARRAVVLRM